MFSHLNLPSISALSQSQHSLTPIPFHNLFNAPVTIPYDLSRANNISLDLNSLDAMTNELTATYGLHGDLTPGFHLGLDHHHHHTPSQVYNTARGHSPPSSSHGHQDTITVRYLTENDRPIRPLPARPLTRDPRASQLIRATPPHNTAQNATFPETGVSWGMSENPETMRARASRKQKVKRKATGDTNARASTSEKKAKPNPPLRVRRVRVEDLTPGISARPQSQEVMSNTSLSSPKFCFRLPAAKRAEFEAVNGRWGSLVERVNPGKPVFVSKLLFFPESRLLASLFTAFPGFDRAWFFCLTESPLTFACPFCPPDSAATLNVQDGVGIQAHGSIAHNVEGKPGRVWYFDERNRIQEGAHTRFGEYVLRHVMHCFCPWCWVKTTKQDDAMRHLLKCEKWKSAVGGGTLDYEQWLLGQGDHFGSKDMDGDVEMFCDEFVESECKELCTKPMPFLDEILATHDLV